MSVVFFGPLYLLTAALKSDYHILLQIAYIHQGRALQL